MADASFQTRPAHGVEHDADMSLKAVLAAMPHWVFIAAGGLGAAIMGAMLGGALHI